MRYVGALARAESTGFQGAGADGGGAKKVSCCVLFLIGCIVLATVVSPLLRVF